MSQIIEVKLSKEDLIKMIKGELFQDENSQALNEYHVDIGGDNSSSVYATISTEVKVVEYLGKIKETLDGNTIKGIISSKMKNDLGKVTTICSNFEKVDGVLQFIGYTVYIDPIKSKSFLTKKYVFN